MHTVLARLPRTARRSSFPPAMLTLLHCRQAAPVVVARAKCAAMLLVTSLPLASALGACADRGRRGELTVVLDSIRAERPSEVVLVPADPASLLAPPASAPPVPRERADSVARWRRLADSASALDRRFQTERAAINREVRAMEGGDRRSTDYARRFDDIQRRTIAAESLRTMRDGLRRRAALVRPAGATDSPAAADARARLLAVADGPRRAHTLRIGRHPVSVRLPPGSWWIGVADTADVPGSFTRFEVRAGARDTVRP